MKNKLLLSGLLLLLMCPLSQLTKAQNSLIFRFSNGTQNNVLLSSLNKITFSSESMFLKMNDATTNSFAISGMSKMTFGFLAGLSDLFDETSPSVYPNPAADFIKLKNLPEGEMGITVFRLDGAAVIQKVLSSASQPIDISGLSRGLYLIRIGNKTLKFAKQ